MAYEITNTDNDLITFASERIGDLDRMIRELRDIIQEMARLDDDLGEHIDPDGLADRLLDRLEESRSFAQEAYNEAREQQTQAITDLLRPVYAPEVPANEEYHCGEHGDVRITSERTTPGFAGSIYVAELSCGCQIVDDSDDGLEAAR
jgi:hypothetical protein